MGAESSEPGVSYGAELSAASNDHFSRALRVEQIVSDCMRRRMSEEVVLDETILADHAELLPELETALARLHLIEAARRRADEEDEFENTPSVSDTATTPPPDSSLVVRCPSCHSPTSIPVQESISLITCGQCGSQFSLVGEPTEELGAGDTLGHFRIERLLGRGGFGLVFKAHDAQLDRSVAIKIPRQGRLSAEEAEQFLREARAAAQLHHPHIVSVYEVGRHADSIYIVSEFIDGTSLSERLNCDEKFTAYEAVLLCQKLAIALQHAHAMGVVHRDLKPGNVLIDSAGEPHITDFGLARRETGEVTMTLDGVLVGTPAYMSPEQARGESHAANARSDIYSLGVILFELLTGEVPFRGNVRMVTQQILNDDAPSPRKLNATIPRDVETICLKAMAKEPARRYANASDFGADLSRYLGGRPILARPLRRAERGWRWCKRNPVVAGLLIAIAFTLISGTVVSALLAIRAAVAETDAQTKLADSYLAQARALRVSQRPGQRFYALDAIRQATAIVGPSREFADEAASALCLPDMVPSREWHGFPSGAQSIAFDAALGKYARSDSQNRISVRRIEGDVEILQFSVPPPPIADYGGLEFSPDGRLLHVGCIDSASKRSLLYDIDNTGARLILDDNRFAHAFSPDSRQLAAWYDDGTLRIYDTATGKEMQRHHVPFIDPGPIRWNPLRPMLLIIHPSTGWTILDLVSGEVGKDVKSPVICMSWHPNGTDVAACTNDTRSILLFEAMTGKQVSPPMSLTAFKGGLAWFNHRGDLMITNDWSQMRRLWDPYDGRELLKLPAQDHNFFIFDRTDKLAAASIIGQTVQLLKVAAGSEERIVRTELSQANAGLHQTALDADGRLLVVERDSGMSLIDARIGRVIEVLDSPDTLRPVGFDSSGVLLGFAGNRLRRWPVTWSAEGHLLRVARPLDIPAPYVGMDADQSRNGQVIAFAHSDRAHIIHMQSEPVFLQTPSMRQDIRYCSVSPDGHFLATGSHSPALDVGNACVWNTTTGEHVKSLPCGAHCNVRFSNQGTWLAVVSGIDRSCRLWRVADWHPGPAFGAGFSPVFTPDDRLIAIGAELGQIHFYETKSGMQIGRLYSREMNRLSPRCFSPDGTRLYALNEETGAVHIWDLARIYAGLVELGLESHWPEFRRTERSDDVPKTFSIEVHAQ